MLSADRLYQPDKYKVHVGKGQGAGFCTVWNEPEIVLKRAPELMETCAIVGTLYGRNGVNAIVRNLALNPTIRKIYVWGSGNLSQTKFGKVGTDILFTLWQKGINEDHTVKETSFKLDKEIDIKILERVIAHVELVDISTQPLEEVTQMVGGAVGEAYMESVRFPDAQPQAVDTYPSEEIGWAIHGGGIIDTWSRLVQRIMMYGNVKGTQYGSQQKELIGATWVVREEDPDAPILPEEWPRDLREVTGATLDAIQQYHQVFLSPECPPGISYTYGNRLMSYPNGETRIDQIAEVIEHCLRTSPDSRRATATTMFPQVDKDSNEPPCLTQLQCIQSHGALHALATFRSHDIWKAAIPNAFGLRKLQKKMCEDLGFSLGRLQITSQSAHIYESDWESARKFVACQFTERDPELAFNAMDGDPRGNVIIQLQNGKIVMTLMGSDGAELFKIEGASARFVQRKLGHMDLLSRADHLLDIGMELQKAQIAKEKGLTYTQDRPLVI